MGGLWGIEDDEGYVQIDRLGITRTSFDKGTAGEVRPSGRPLGYRGAMRGMFGSMGWE